MKRLNDKTILFAAGLGCRCLLHYRCKHILDFGNKISQSHEFFFDEIFLGIGLGAFIEQLAGFLYHQEFHIGRLSVDPIIYGIFAFSEETVAFIPSSDDCLIVLDVFIDIFHEFAYGGVFVSQ